MKQNHLFNEYGYYTGEQFPTECIHDCSHGQVDSAVKYWRVKLEFTVPEDLTKRYLRSTGGWSAEELADFDSDRLAETVLWLACCDIRESGEWFGLCE